MTTCEKVDKEEDVEEAMSKLVSNGDILVWPPDGHDGAVTSVDALGYPVSIGLKILLLGGINCCDCLIQSFNILLNCSYSKHIQSSLKRLTCLIQWRHQ